MRDTLQKYRDFIGPNPLFDRLTKDIKPSKDTSNKSLSPYAYTSTPNFINGELRHYQIEGVNWLISMHTLSINVVLADEMGLGKTLQTITFLGYLKQIEVDLPHLLIVPKSTLNNWKTEFHKFYPKYRIYILHCPRSEQKQERKKLLNSKFDIIITTYEMCINTSILNRIKFYYLIIDEAHRIKNENSKLSLLVRQYRVERRMLITGTPLQNNVRELWALLNFLVPEIFQDCEAFEGLLQKEDNRSDDAPEDDILEDISAVSDNAIEDNAAKKLKRSIEISESNEENSYIDAVNHKSGSNNEKTDKTTGDVPINESIDTGFSEDISCLRKMIMPFFLRREKSEVETSLLPKKIINLYPSLTEMQRIWYRTILKKDLKAELNIHDKSSLMNVVCQLRKVCNHPYLFDGAEPEPFSTDEHIVTNSSKMIILDKLLLKCIKDNSRVLIFSQMSRMLDILEDYCVMREYSYRRLDGSTSSEERTKGIDEFNSDPSIFIYLLTTRAGGLGINLTSADTVIIYDSDWNPQMDLQAMDRAHRIGQKKEVKVYRLIVANTIEEKILERCMHKLKLDECLMKKRNDKLHRNELLNIISTGIENLQNENSNDLIDIEEVLKLGTAKTLELNERINGIEFGEHKGLDLYKWEGEDYKKRVKKLEEIIEVEMSKKEKKKLVVVDYQFYPKGYEELLNKEELNEEEKIVKEEMEKKGFNLSRKEFVSYLKSVEAMGKDDVMKIINHMKNKGKRKEHEEDDDSNDYKVTNMADHGASNCNPDDMDAILDDNVYINGMFVADWKRYHKIFWERKDEIQDFDKILSQIERNEAKKFKNENVKKILQKVFGQTYSKNDLKKVLKQNGFLFFDNFKLVYSQNVKSKYYTEIVDKTLLFLYYNFDNLDEKLKIVKEILFSLDWIKHDYYILTRDEIELGKRISALTGMLLKKM